MVTPICRCGLNPGLWCGDCWINEEIKVSEFKQVTPFFIVWNQRGPHNPTKRYRDIALAEADAKILADLNPGKRFHVCVVLGYANKHKEVVDAKPKA
jgi:hypothetical protein